MGLSSTSPRKTKNEICFCFSCVCLHDLRKAKRKNINVCIAKNNKRNQLFAVCITDSIGGEKNSCDADSNQVGTQTQPKQNSLHLIFASNSDWSELLTKAAAEPDMSRMRSRKDVPGIARNSNADTWKKGSFLFWRKGENPISLPSFFACGREKMPDI